LEYLKLLNAYHSFNQGHYGVAMTTFFQAGLDPLQVIALFGSLLPLNLKPKFRFPIQIEELSMACDLRVLTLQRGQLTQRLWSL
jgi:hypothetical protein